LFTALLHTHFEEATKVLDRRRSKRLGSIGKVVVTLNALAIAGGVAGFTVLPAAAAATLVVTPHTGLTQGQSVTVTGSGLDAFNGQSVAVVECGNADSSGAALPGTQPAQTDCYGAESLNTQTLLLTVASGTASTQYPVQTQNIGTNKRQCITQANFDCVIAMADVSTQGKALQIAAPITFAGGSPPPTTPPTTPTTAPPSSGGGTVSSTSTASATANGVSQSTAQAATTTTAVKAKSSSSSLPFTGTGSPRSLVLMVIVGVVLLDLGYLAATVNRRPRRQRTP
jgi:hypothetical protein